MADKLNYVIEGTQVNAETITIPSDSPYKVNTVHDHIKDDSPSSMVEIWQNNDKSGNQLTEEAYTGTVSGTGKFQVDYEGAEETTGIKRCSTVLFHSAQAGTSWYIWYKSTGDEAEAGDINSKADKVSGATSSNFAGLDADGNLTDSGKKPADFTQNAFSTISISGQTNVTADSPDDVLTIVAGQNVNITTDPSGDSITIISIKPDFTADIPAGAWDYPSSNPAMMDRDTGTNGTIYRIRFDDTTEETVESIIKLPPDLNPSGMVTFEAIGYSVTATIGNRNINLKISHSPINSGESWDAAYTVVCSGDYTCCVTQDYLDSISWGLSVASLGWTLEDETRIKLSRVAVTTQGLAGDWGLTHFRVRVGRL